jgi:hypothetical protein
VDSTATDRFDTSRFEASRNRLASLAYRLLGSAADAEDTVQDAFLRWQAADRQRITVPEAWLTNQAEQQSAPVDPGGEQGDRRRPDHHPEGVRGDRVRRDRNRHVQIGREQLDDAVAAELAGADRKGAERQREQRQLRVADGRFRDGVPLFLDSALTVVGVLVHRLVLGRRNQLTGVRDEQRHRAVLPSFRVSARRA